MYVIPVTMTFYYWFLIIRFWKFVGLKMFGIIRFSLPSLPYFIHIHYLLCIQNYSIHHALLYVYACYATNNSEKVHHICFAACISTLGTSFYSNDFLITLWTTKQNLWNTVGIWTKYTVNIWHSTRKYQYRATMLNRCY